MNKLSITAILLHFFIGLQAQEKPVGFSQTPSYVIEKEKGAVLVCNNYLESGINFYLNLPYTIKSSGREGIYLVKNNALQIFLMDASRFNGNNSIEKIKQYVKYECDYIKETFGDEVPYETQEAKGKKINPLLIWYFSMPKVAGMEFSHQVFVCFIHKSYIFSISTPLAIGSSLDQAKTFLLEVADNISFSEKVITWELLKKAIK